MFGWGKKEKNITPDQIEILIHTDAAYFGEHGRMLATNKELGIVEKPVIFCLKGYTTPLPLNHRMYAHIWNSFLADGWIPLEMIKYGSVIDKSMFGEPEVTPAQGRRVTHLALAEGMSASEAQSHVEAVARQHNGEFAGLEVPAYLRKEAQEGTGFKSAGFDAATATA
jgi:hypothetical protein